MPLIEAGSKFQTAHSIFDGVNTQYFDLEIGDVLDTNFQPQVKIKRWNNECNFSMRLLGHGTAAPDKNPVFDGTKATWGGNGASAEFYQLADDTGFEFAVRFNAQPPTADIKFSLESKGFVFDKQTSGDPAVNGSYAVYHDSKAHNKYGTGKGFHIWTPWIEGMVNAVLTRVYCTIDINVPLKIMTISIPQAFYDTVDWSDVLLDPTLGYTTIGASTINTLSAPCYNLGPMPENGTLDSVVMYISSFNTTAREGTMAVYRDSSGVPGALLSSSASVFVEATSPTWHSETMSGSLTSGEELYAAIQGENSASAIYFDSVSGYTRWTNAQTFPTWADPYSNTGSTASRRASAYINYTASGGGVSLLPRRYGRGVCRGVVRGS
jgi:hypothetical protein